MPLIDKPLEELLTYGGTNPRPDDFDNFWDEALAEMDAQNSHVELRPARFNAPTADCFDLFFTGVGGSRVHAKYLRPRYTNGRNPAVLMFHGYSNDSGNWHSKLSYVGLNFSIFAMDCRGQGGISEDLGGVRGNTFKGQIIRGLDDDPRKFAFRQIFLDTAQLAKIAMGFDHIDPERIGVLGGSQGGALTLACASLVPGIRRAAPAYPFLSDYQRVWEMDLAEEAYEEIRTYFRRYDPRHERQHEIFTKLGYIDIQNLTPRIQAEVLMGTGLMDTVCPPSTQFAAYNKITSPKNVVIYPDFGHESLPGFDDQTFEFMAGL